VWPLVLRLAYLPGCPAVTAVRLLRRYLQFDPAYAEEFIAYLVSAGRFREAAEQLASAISDDGFRSAKGTTKRQLLLDLCDLVAKHPDDVAGLPVEAILRSAVRKFPEEYGVLWTTLAGHYARKGVQNKARDVLEEATAAATTVKDFRLVFESYLHFEHAMAAAELELDKGGQEESSASVLQGCWLADKDDADLNLAKLERLLERRPELLNCVQLRQNPHDVQVWHDRVKIFHTDPARQAAAYAEALSAIDPMKATGKPHTLWLAFAKMYEGRGLLDSAREVFRRATQVNFKAVDDLAAVWCEWAEMELRHGNPETATDLVRQATSEPSAEVRRRVAAAPAERGEPAQIKLHRSLKLWCLYADLMETHGTPESACAVYERIHDLGLTTPLLVLNHASLLREHERFEDAFRVYQRGVRSFKHPHAEPIWAAYLTQFVQRYGKSRPERVRDLFEDAVRQAPPQLKKAMFLRYAKFEEDFGLATRAMKVYEDAASAVPSRDKLGVYDVYVGRAAAMFGVVKAREIYHQAICEGGLPDEDARAICVRFADLEMGLGEVQRARALYVYASGFTDPSTHPDFWKRWNAFEVLHGDESTFREMLRLKRTVTMNAHAIVEAKAEIATMKRPCAGQQVEDSGMMPPESKRMRIA